MRFGINSNFKKGNKMIRTKICMIILMLFLAASCSQQDSNWKGSIKTEDGVTIVENPIEPMYSGDVLELEEDLVIGKAENEDDYLFQTISAVRADDEGRIFVNRYETDPESRHYDVFDPEGKYISKLVVKDHLTFWKSGKLYSMAEDPNGYQYIIRYKVNWN